MSQGVSSARTAALVRLALTLGLSGLIAWLLARHLGLHPAPLRIDLARLPWMASVAARVPDHTVEILRPQLLWGAVFLPYFALVVGSSLADLPSLQRALGVVVRAALVSLVLLALARPSATSRSHKVCTVFLIDVSESVSDEALADARATLESAIRARGENLVRAVTFARRPRGISLPEALAPGQHVSTIVRHETATRAGAGTDLAAALSLSYGLFPPGYLRRGVVLSDGVQTDGDALAEASRAARFGVRVSTVPNRRPVPAEIAVREMRLPEHIRVNEPFEVRVGVFASRASRAALTLMQGEAVNGLEGTRTVDLHPGDNEVRFRSVVRVPGDVTYAVSLAPEGGPTADRFRENNRYVTTATVPGRPSVLYVEGDTGHSEYLRSALDAGDFEVETRGGREFPQTLREMERFDFIILSDVGAEMVSAGAQDALSRYVRDLGGGFMMAGGPRSFGLGGWQGTEVERLLPVRMDSERRHDQPSVALCIVMDRSGSMQGRPLQLAQAAALATARALGPDDLIEVIAFDTEPTTLVRMQAASNRARIADSISRLRPGGGTAIFPGLDLASRDLALARAVTRHVILLTDGQGQPDEPPHIEEVVRSMVSDGITVSAVGLGTQVDRHLLEQIGRTWGGGRSYFTADANNLPQIFLRETSLVSRSAVVEEPVSPRVVAHAGFLREVEGGAIPYLYGYVSTRPKPEPAVVLMETDTDPVEPLLARWRVGLGWSLAWTSDVKNRWAVEWIHWPRWQAFWSQLVREHMRQRRRHELGLRAELIGGVVHVAVDAITQDDRFDNGLTSELTLRGPQPGGREDRVPMRQVAPGRYEADVPLDRYGAFALHAVHRRDGAVVAESFGQVNNPYPREYAAVEPDVATLTALAQATRGEVDPSPAAMFDAHGESVAHAMSLWKFPIFGAVGLLLLDLLLRRVRLFDRGFEK